ncbi:MAG: M23 family metallopeptidase [Thermodesulfobacteriota bacterium]
MKKKVLIFFFALLLGIIGYSFFTFFEQTPPSGEWQNRSNYLSNGTILRISVSDIGRGLNRVEITYHQGKNIFPLHLENYSDRETALKKAAFEIPVDLKKLGIKDGEGVIAINIQDRSLWNFAKGNSTSLKYAVAVDTKPPLVTILTTDHVVIQGGSEITVYKASADTVTTGVKVGEYFFPGHKGTFEDENTYLAFFSYPYNLPPGEPIFIIAQDGAGNTVKKNLSILVKPKRYRNRTIKLTDKFLRRKLPELISIANLEESGDLLKDFLFVNREVRGQQDEKIKIITKDSKPELMWKGGFLQLRNAKVESRFADFRTYTYNGKVVDEKYHLGFDLAATKRYPIGASNTGLVVFADNLGIYGNSVIIDHGFGIFTLYSHMNSIDVNEGDRVEKGAVIGKTGETGLAGGDHLHFGVLIHGTPVTPIEWWDKKWVKNRILRRIKAAED